jgi:hypothetical protein
MTRSQILALAVVVVGSAQQLASFADARPSPTQSDCPARVTSQWFSTVPREIGCTPTPPFASELFYVQADQASPCDIDGDGTSDFWSFQAAASFDVIISGNDQPVPTEQIVLSLLSAVGPEVNARSEATQVFGGSLLQWIRMNYPSVADATVYLRTNDGQSRQIAGWRDMDGDKDLDYIVSVSVYVGPAGQSPEVRRQVWFENTGFEANRKGAAADLNRDGVVNGEDLCIVLAAWSTD